MQVHGNGQIPLQITALIIDQTYSAWLTDSSRNIEEEWDAYVQSVYDIGLTQNLEIRQTAYERYLTSMK